MSDPYNDPYTFDGLVRRSSNEGGLSDAKIESARRFLYEDDDSFSSLGEITTNLSGLDVDQFKNSSSSNSNNNNNNNNSRIMNTMIYYGKNIKHRGRKILLATATTLMLVASIVLIHRHSQNQIQNQNESGHHLHGPRLQQFHTAIAEMGLTSQTDLEDPNTPQYHAVQWVANHDGAKLQPDDPLVLQRYALATLYYKTAGTEDMNDPATAGQWIEADKWLTKSGICAWHGIVCDGDDASDESSENPREDRHGSVQTLELHDNELRGGLPSELSALTDLYKLDLSYNALTGTLPKSLGSLYRLRELDLRDNHITGTIPKTYGHDLSNLRQLILHDNNLEGKIPNEIEHMVELRILELGMNHLTGKVPGLDDLTKIRELVLYANKLEGPFPESISKLTSLVVLNLSHNHFTGVLPEELSHLTRLGE